MRPRAAIVLMLAFLSTSLACTSGSAERDASGCEILPDIGEMPSGGRDLMIVAYQRVCDQPDGWSKDGWTANVSILQSDQEPDSVGNVLVATYEAPGTHPSRGMAFVSFDDSTHASVLYDPRLTVKRQETQVAGVTITFTPDSSRIR